MTEIWKDIEGWEGKYQISNFGRVKSLNYRNTNKEKIMKPQKKDNGYFFIGLRQNGFKKTHYHIHRLVAGAFIPNPNNLPQVNHKDEDKSNNFVWVNDDGTVDPEKSNLEWCDAKYNLNYGNRHKKEIQTQQLTHPTCKAVEMYTIGGVFLKRYISQRAAERETGILSSSIGLCCRKKLKTAGGFIWRYLD